ncbi:hypothetical protein AD952_10580 [Acetobacter cerevisiae]|uniref:Uncharacterized protein n=1 Tax=Acetobacter cerevisiae TaxID=178900 RepID=A0A149UST4_9PROT|nr:hypothetical protein AD952_10580 [Acetobacter cerevisiae]
MYFPLLSLALSPILEAPTTSLALLVRRVLGDSLYWANHSQQKPLRTGDSSGRLLKMKIFMNRLVLLQNIFLNNLLLAWDK